MDEIAAACALEQHVLAIRTSLEAKQEDVERISKRVRFEAASVQQLQGSTVAIERIHKRLVVFPDGEESSSGVRPPLELSFTFAQERSLQPMLLELNDFEARLSTPNGAPLFCITETSAERQELAPIDALVAAWTHADGVHSERNARWLLSFLLTHPSDHAFDAVSTILMEEAAE